MSFEVSARVLTEGAVHAGPVARAGIVAVTDRAEWDALVAAAAFAHLPQTWAYGEAKATHGWHVVRVRFVSDGVTVAFAQVLERRVLGLRVVTRINRGPVMLSATPHPATMAAVYTAVRAHWGHFWQGAALFAPALLHGDAASALLRDAGFLRRHDNGWSSATIDLTRDEAAIFASFDSRFRNRYRGAERAGATVRIANDAATLEWMIARHRENMRAKQFHSVDATFLRAHAAASGDNLLMFQLMLQGEPVAGMLVQRFGDRCEYHVGWFGEAGRKVNAGNYLMWQIVREMKRRGCREFDVGGLREGAGYTQFKRLMHGTEYRLVGEWISF